jgi:two-component SAPR family response regulator
MKIASGPHRVGPEITESYPSMGHQPGYGIEIRTLGKFEVIIDGRPIVRWRAGKARDLLQYLLLSPGRVIPRDVLFEALWPELDAPRSSLNVAIHMLRKALMMKRPAAAEHASEIRIITHEHGYSIETNAWIDFIEFDSLIRCAQQHDNLAMSEDAIADLGAATDLYHGDFLPGTTTHWAEPHREWLRSLALSALWRLATIAAQDGEDLQVIHYGRKILEIEPLHEETYRMLIGMHGKLGQISQADRWYRLCASRLQDFLGISPTDMTRSVYSRAVSGELMTTRELDPGLAVSVVNRRPPAWKAGDRQPQ